MRGKKTTIIAIIIFLVLGLGAFAGLLYAKNAENKAAEVAEQQAIEQAEKEAAEAAEKERQEAEQKEYQLADHVYSHRGASAEEIEHTFAAYDKAIAQGSHNIEQDLVLSADGTLYVSHDLTSNRIAGAGGSFSGMTDSQIDALTTADGQKILKMSDVFDRYGKNVKYIIELKSSDSRTVDAFRSIVEEYDMKDQIVVQCLELQALKTLEEYYPDMPKLYLVKDQGSFEYGLTKEYVDILGVQSSLMSASNCDRAHDSGKEFNVWTLDTDSEIIMAINMGADSYFTNHTDRAIALEREYREE